MGRRASFKFLDNALNRQLIALLREAGIKHEVRDDATVCYAPEDEDVIENDFICPIREKVFPSWQILTCPPEWSLRYKSYMSRHSIPFREELSNGDLWFLIPRKHRPHMWKLDGRKSTQRIAL